MVVVLLIKSKGLSSGFPAFRERPNMALWDFKGWSYLSLSCKNCCSACINIHWIRKSKNNSLAYCFGRLKFWVLKQRINYFMLKDQFQQEQNWEISIPGNLLAEDLGHYFDSWRKEKDTTLPWPTPSIIGAQTTGPADLQGKHVPLLEETCLNLELSMKQVRGPAL